MDFNCAGPRVGIGKSWFRSRFTSDMFPKQGREYKRKEDVKEGKEGSYCNACYGREEKVSSWGSTANPEERADKGGGCKGELYSGEVSVAGN
jgi:hypothetical protein